MIILKFNHRPTFALLPFHGKSTLKKFIFNSSEIKKKINFYVRDPYKINFHAKNHQKKLILGHKNYVFKLTN